MKCPERQFRRHTEWISGYLVLGGVWWLGVVADWGPSFLLEVMKVF